MISKINKYKRSCILLCILLCICGSIAAANYDEVIDEITNSRKESVYNLELNAPFSKDTSGIHEVIEPETGELSTSIDLFTLQGRGGVESTAISLTYSTAYASFKEESVEKKSNNYVNTVSDKSAFLQSVESFGIGWRLQLPYVERPDGRNSTVIYVHLVDGSVYKANGNGLINYKLTDVSFAGKSETRNGVDTAYILRYATGDAYYFNASGYPVEKTDRFGNRVFYNWSGGTVPKLLSISDDSGDVVYFKYNENTLAVSHNERYYILHRKKAGDGWLISKVTDPVGRTTEFDYEARAFYFNFWGEARGGTSNTYYLLKSVSYPTGFVSRYTYITGTKWLYKEENGSMQYARVSERFDADGEERTNYISYSYTREPDGWPGGRSATLPANYIYTTTLTDNYDTQTTYVYDGNHDQVKMSITVGGKLSSVEVRQFDSKSRMPKMFIKTLYNKNGESRNVYTESRFDGRGNLVYEDTYENSESAGKNVKEYAYSAAANLCVYESSFQDTNTKVEIKRTVGPGGGTIINESVYRNGTLIKSDSFAYDEYNNLKESRVQNNETDTVTTQYIYSADTFFQLPAQMTVAGIKNSDGEEDSYTYGYTYDRYGNVTEIVNPDKSKVSYTYDKLNRQTTEILEDERTRTTAYDDLKNTIRTTDANGYSLLYFYDKYGKLKSVYDDVQSCYLSQRAYDDNGRLVEEKDSRNTKYVYTYDELDRITSIVVYDASGVILSEQYIQYNTAVTQNGKGYTRLFVEQGAAGARRNKVYLFDYLDREVQETEWYGGVERSQYFEYDLAGNKVSYTAKDGAETKYAYDIFGNVTYALLPDGTENFFEYDYNGNCQKEINGAGEEILYSYDGLGRLTKKETTSGETRSIFRNYYNFRNNAVVSLDAENNRTEYSYDLRGFLTGVRQYSNGVSGQETEYTYDGEGNILSHATGAIGDSNKNVYRYELDALGRCVKETDPMGNVAEYAYEPDGNLSRSIDKNGIVTTYTYDGLGRLIKEENGKSGSLSYTYNGFDEVTDITDGKLTVKAEYNYYGETVKIIRARNEESFTYDAAGRVVLHTIDDRDIGTITSRYSYDALGRTTAIETDGGSENICYDKAGRISERSYPQTGVIKKYTYYEDGTLKGLITYIDDKLITSESIEYDRNGNKTVWEQDGKITNYTYDGMNRLQGVQESNGVLTEYEFDSFGNISKEYTLTASGIKTTQYQYDGNNCLLISYDDRSSTRYTYDKSGNLINKIYELSGRETKSYYSYDGYNRLSEFVSGDTTAEYSYNPEGLRESKTVNGNYTRFIYDGEDIVGELTNDNYYIYYRGTELISSKSYDNHSHYYRLDSHGNVTDLVNHLGESQKSYSYTPYGEEKLFGLNPTGEQTILYYWQKETDGTHNPFRYCGEYYDEESGLIYLRNRYYDPTTGRFITEDPARDGMNWYVYCGGNPVNRVDSSGLEYIPLRTTAENEGYGVSWDPNTLSAGVWNDDYNIITNFTVGIGEEGKKPYINNDGRMMVWDETYYQNTMLTDDDAKVGVTVKKIDGVWYKDFSMPINNSLNDIVQKAEMMNLLCGDISKGMWFISQVNHNKPWDIKRPTPWNNTIGSNTHPGNNVHVVYNGWLATPEELGNYAYAYIGRALGFNLPTLYVGSWFAAGRPCSGKELESEFDDWPAITKGYNNYGKDFWR